MYVLVFTLILTGNIGFYSGDAENRQTGRPTKFETLEACEKVREMQLVKLTEAHEADSSLPEFKLECFNMGAGMPREQPKHEI